jgi:WD40 repeat protein
VISVAFSSDSKLLASGSWDNTIKLWDYINLTEISTLKGHESWVWSIAFSPNC